MREAPKFDDSEDEMFDPTNRFILTDLIENAVDNAFKKYLKLLKDPVDPDPPVKIEVICEMLKVSKVTIHKWKKEGKIPFERIGKRIFFRKLAVQAALKKINPIK